MRLLPLAAVFAAFLLFTRAGAVQPRPIQHTWSGDLTLDQAIKLALASFRAPGHVEGAFGLECAMDALARELALDPLELRRKNYAAHDQEKDRRYSDKKLDDCYRMGAERFGWKPIGAAGAAENARFKRGKGMSSISWGAGGGPPAYATVRLNPDGTVDVLTGSQDLGTRLRQLPAQHGADTGDELARAEWLGHVVVSPQLQADQRVRFVVAGRQHDDRHGGIAAQLPRHVEAVETRQTKVEDHQVGAVGARAHERLGAVAGAPHREPGPLQVIADELRDPGLVVDDEDRLHRSAW